MSRLQRKLDESDIDLTDLLDDDIEDKILTPEEERRKKIQHRITALAMCLTVVVIIGAIVFSMKEKNRPDEERKNNTVQQTETVPEASANLLENEQYPEISELIQLYYDAKLKGDTAAIEKYVDNIEEVNMDKITAQNQFIESYENMECYTKLGLYDNTYVVFVSYEIAFKNIDTYAPNIDVVYVIRDEETGSVFIHNGVTANADIKNYVAALAEDEDVKELFDRTNASLEEALKEDADLNNLFKALEKGTVNENDK